MTNVTIIRARSLGVGARLLDLWRFRAFFPFLMKEQVEKLTRNKLLGFWWLIIRPGIPAATALFVFMFVIPMQTTGNIPYPIFFLSAYVGWSFFQYTLRFGSRCMSGVRGIMKRTYFPRMLVPLASIGMPLIYAGVVSGLLFLAVAFYAIKDGVFYVQFSFALLWVPVSISFIMLFAMSFALVLSLVALVARDLRYAIRHIAQPFMLTAPVFYPITLVDEQWRWLLFINPLSAQIETFRYGLLGIGEFHSVALPISMAVIVALFALAVGFFLRAERYLADEL